MNEKYKPITSMREVPEHLRKLRRQYLRYQQVEIEFYGCLLFRKGEVDYLTSVSVDQVPYLQADDDVDLIAYDNFAWNFMMMNENDPHFADQKVRNAIYYALDLKYIIDTALDGRGTPAPVPVNGSIAGYMEGCNDTEFDLNKAKECVWLSLLIRMVLI